MFRTRKDTPRDIRSRFPLVRFKIYVLGTLCPITVQFQRLDLRGSSRLLSCVQKPLAGIRVAPTLHHFLTHFCSDSASDEEGKVVPLVETSRVVLSTQIAAVGRCGPPWTATVDRRSPPPATASQLRRSSFLSSLSWLELGVCVWVCDKMKGKWVKPPLYPGSFYPVSTQRVRHCVPELIPRPGFSSPFIYFMKETINW
jgi:hypothetical protein